MPEFKNRGDRSFGRPNRHRDLSVRKISVPMRNLAKVSREIKPELKLKVEKKEIENGKKI